MHIDLVWNAGFQACPSECHHPDVVNDKERLDRRVHHNLDRLILATLEDQNCQQKEYTWGNNSTYLHVFPALPHCFSPSTRGI